MALTQKDIKNRIGSVKNIQKITRAMEMVAAARLRRAEQRIEALRPYASAIRRMNREAAPAAARLGDPADAPGGGGGGQDRPNPADPAGARVRQQRRDPAGHGRPRAG